MMFAASVVEQSRDRFVIEQMRLDYLLAVRWFDVRIPDVVRIDYYQRTITTLIEAAGLVDAYLAFQSAFFDFLSQDIQDFLRALSWTGLACDADEDVLAKGIIRNFDHRLIISHCSAVFP